MPHQLLLRVIHCFIPVPRALLIDLEPRVVNKLTHQGPYRNLLNDEHVFIAQDGGGAGNKQQLGLGLLAG